MQSRSDIEAPILFRAAVPLVAALQLAAALHQTYVAFEGRFFNACLAVVLFMGAVGLLRGARWGRRISVAFLWGAIVVGFGTLSPYRADDLAAVGIRSLSVLALGIRFFCICAVAIGCLHVLGKYKERFRAEWL